MLTLVVNPYFLVLDCNLKAVQPVFNLLIHLSAPPTSDSLRPLSVISRCMDWWRGVHASAGSGAENCWRKFFM